MRISPDLVFGLRDRGIIVRWFPEKTFEEFKQRVWQQQYEYSVNYGKDHVAGCDAVLNGRANLVYNSIEELQERSRQFADNTVRREINPYDYTTLIIEYDADKNVVTVDRQRNFRMIEKFGWVQRFTKTTLTAAWGWQGFSKHLIDWCNFAPGEYSPLNTSQIIELDIKRTA